MVLNEPSLPPLDTKFSGLVRQTCGTESYREDLSRNKSH